MAAKTLSSTGSGMSAFQFAGERRDTTGLTYLWSRHLDNSVGRFVTRDDWDGDPTRPLSKNRWGYVEGDPVNRVDPSGQCCGPLSSVRDNPLLSRLLGCDNLDAAIRIAASSRAGATQRIGAVAFTIAQGGADVIVTFPFLVLGSLTGCRVAPVRR